MQGWGEEDFCDGNKRESLLPGSAQGLCLLQKQRGQKNPPGKPGDFVRLEDIEMVLWLCLLSFLIQPLAAKAYYAEEAGAHEQYGGGFGDRGGIKGDGNTASYQSVDDPIASAKIIQLCQVCISQTHTNRIAGLG